MLKIESELSCNPAIKSITSLFALPFLNIIFSTRNYDDNTSCNPVDDLVIKRHIRIIKDER